MVAIGPARRGGWPDVARRVTENLGGPEARWHSTWMSRTPVPTGSTEFPPAVIDACRLGDRDALDMVFRAHAAVLERLLVRLVGPGGDTEDLLQETFAEAIRAFPRFRGDASVTTWLHRIAVFVTHHHLRSPHHRRAVPLELVPDELDEDRPEDRPDRQLETREQLARLYGHLEALDPPKRIAFLLHVVNDHPLAEVAALMGASRAATKSRVFWARRALRSRLRRDPALREYLCRGREEP